MKRISKRSWIIALVIGVVLLAPAVVNIDGRSVYAVLLDPPKTPAVPEPPAATRDARWRQDLAYLAKELPRLHLDAFRVTPKASFDALVSNLETRIPKLSDNAIAVGMMRVVSSLKDGHTIMFMPDSFTTYPFAVQWFGKELRVVGTQREFKELFGARVLKIGTLPPQQALERVREVLSYETEQDFRARSEGALVSPQILAALGIQSDESIGRFEFQLASGTVKQQSFDSSTNVTPKELGADLFYRQRSSEPHWLEYLADSDSIYFRYSSCEDREGFNRLVNQVVEFIKTRQPKRIIIDLRGNSGGDNSILPSLIGALKTGKLNVRGAIFAAINAGTFSSAADAVMQLRENLPVIVVGTPTGGAINGFGEVKRLTLANSQLTLIYSTKYFNLEPGKIGGYDPDVRVDPSFEDWQQGRDPVLEAMLAWKP